MRARGTCRHMLGKLAVAALLLLPFATAAPLLVAPCSVLPGELADTSCAPIGPGARMTAPGGCTLNFVVTDGTELYIGTAGHCVGLGSRVSVAGRADIGTTILDGARGDWAFIRIDPEDRAFVDPTMRGWGGPSAVRAPMTGEVVLHYGWGASLGQIDATRARAGEVLVGIPGSTSSTVIYAGAVDGGDSGSPVMTATGEAGGIAVATIFAGPAPVPVTFASRFDLAMDELGDALGRPVTLVEGRAFVAAP